MQFWGLHVFAYFYRHIRPLLRIQLARHFPASPSSIALFFWSVALFFGPVALFFWPVSSPLTAAFEFPRLLNLISPVPFLFDTIPSNLELRGADLRKIVQSLTYRTRLPVSTLSQGEVGNATYRLLFLRLRFSRLPQARASNDWRSPTHTTGPRPGEFPECDIRPAIMTTQHRTPSRW
ncbi:hypothetical protein BZA05DRAFT_407816 [Tricharina praecox]|uniref:uncharacterized protein n=1 Tax=Tricharina praecox TaxID=43433 RepID=UPI00221F5E0D|nr:uncharacterized protein BZA05DRAFT_407816 [Tricharina praecox]KAI5845493.1 hypothetical protein BZA05DRAFT_407816 [Tricharina praecox]